MNTTKNVLDKNFYKAFIRNLGRLLEKTHSTQAQLAKSIGISQNSVSSWFNGSEPKSLCQLFGIISFFYERLEDFNPLELFLVEDIENGKDFTLPPVIIDKELEYQRKVFEEYKTKELEHIQKEKKAIQNIIDEKVKIRTANIENEKNSTIRRIERDCDAKIKKFEQVADSEISKRKQLEEELKIYKQNFFGILDIDEKQFSSIAENVPIYFGDKKESLKKIFQSPELIEILVKVMQQGVTQEQSDDYYKELGKGFYNAVRNIYKA